MIQTILALVLTAAPLSHPFTIRVADAGGGFSVDLPIVARVHGVSTMYFTSLDITNNTAQPTDVDFFYTPSDGSAPRSGTFGTLLGFANLHTDDVLQSLAMAGLITPNQAASSYGTLLLTFTNPSFHLGTEATAVTRVWSYASGNSGPTFGLGYRARVLHTGGAHALTSIVRAGNGLVSNLGLENVGINDAGAVDNTPVTLRLTFYDPDSGAIVGTQPTVSLAPGQVLQINNVTSLYNLPPNAASLLVFVDEIAGDSQIAGYVVMKDNGTSDGSLVFMQESKTGTF
jgi:hypothetical protein